MKKKEVIKKIKEEMMKGQKRTEEWSERGQKNEGNYWWSLGYAAGMQNILMLVEGMEEENSFKKRKDK